MEDPPPVMALCVLWALYSSIGSMMMGRLLKASLAFSTHAHPSADIDCKQFMILELSAPVPPSQRL
jgi:hypothetical protein